MHRRSRQCRIVLGDKLDILILNGDIINDVSSEYQISIIYKIANKITGGARPVIFARGNHECNGTLASSLGKYVGCADRGFYYTYTVGNLKLTVLDTANDMSDDNWLISPIANFDEVRASESGWLKAIGGGEQSYRYNFVVAHMAYPLQSYRSDSCNWHDWASELVQLTEGNQLAICGHSHKTDYTLPQTSGGNSTASFPVIRGSIRSNKYADKEGIGTFEFTGTAIEINGERVTIRFTNADKKVMATYSLEV